MDFGTLLATSLLSDYFLISSVTLPDAENEFRLQTPLAPHYAYITRNLGIERDMYDSQDGTWVQMIFTQNNGKENLSEYFNSINNSYRIFASQIYMPDIYDGSPHPKQELWDTYLGGIVRFFANNSSVKSYAEFQGIINIPVQDAEGFQRQHAVYSANGFHGIVLAT